MTTRNSMAKELDAAYAKAHDAASAALQANVIPRDIRATWGNTLGMLRRCTGSKHHQPGPNGSVDEPTQKEKSALLLYFKVTEQRCNRALSRQKG